MLRSFANKVTNLVRRDSIFVVVVKSTMNFSAAFEKEHDVSFLATRMEDIFENMDSSDILTNNSVHTYQRYILVAKFPLQHPNLRDINNKVYKEKARTWTLAAS